jgi:hypothetical protein
MEPYIVDIDDFHEENDGLLLLERIKTVLPEFKATLFTVVGLCSWRFIESIREHYPWLDMAPHGMVHDLTRECAVWTREECARCLDLSEEMGLTKGFRAPGWRISEGTYQELNCRGYWVADLMGNAACRPSGMKYYVLDAPNKLHFHVQNNKFCNGLEESMEKILALDRARPFAFIRDLF